MLRCKRTPYRVVRAGFGPEKGVLKTRWLYWLYAERGRRVVQGCYTPEFTLAGDGD